MKPNSADSYFSMTADQKVKLERNIQELEQRIEERNRSRERRVKHTPVEFDRRINDRRKS